MANFGGSLRQCMLIKFVETFRASLIYIKERKFPSSILVVIARFRTHGSSAMTKTFSNAVLTNSSSALAQPSASDSIICIEALRERTTKEGKLEKIEIL